ncbi:MAG: hypothetical protein DWH81_13555 [Planctomycetota bacterium]|nr:MAG: hypothetical protein DWH81_13555 [Planctomycetota bacterium]
MSVKTVKTPQSRCRASVVRCDITPPVGIYHRMWGAALHDKATGVHRPLTATLMWIEPLAPASGKGQIIISLDHCILDTAEIRNIRESVSRVTLIPTENIQVTVTHTHGSGWMSRTRGNLPGGELIGPYLDQLAARMAELALEARPQLEEATIVYGAGCCNLAAHRDYPDVERGLFACGFNPEGTADDTLMVARITGQSGKTLATIVNYACHPTTLAWDNTLISPDWVGAMREVVETHTGGHCLFLQGASGDLGPREGFVGDVEVADRNGRQIGFSALATLTALPPAGTQYNYAGPVISGATIGTWKHEPLSKGDLQSQTAWRWQQINVDLPYRHDLPTIEQTTTEREEWLAEEAKAREAGNEARLRDCRAQIEQRTRQLTRLNALAPGRACPLPVVIGQPGDAIWVMLPGELYQSFQLALRERFAPRPVIVTTLTNDWQPGYIPPAATFGYGIYQEIIAATAPGCHETLIEAISRHVKSWV